MLARHHAVIESVALGGLRVDEVAEHQELGRAAEPDDLRQEMRRTHVGAGQTDLHEQEGDARLGAGDAEVGRQRDHGAGTAVTRSAPPPPGSGARGWRGSAGRSGA
jgi:hypothetical protein